MDGRGADGSAGKAAVAARDLWLIAAAAFGLFLAWTLSTVWLLAFAGWLLALALGVLAAPLQRRLMISPRAALALVVAAIVAATAAGIWFAGNAAAEQAEALREALPKALAALYRWLGSFAPGRWLIGLWQSSNFEAQDLTRFAGLATSTLHMALNAVAAALLIVALGIYVAADPLSYRRGLLQLVPPAHRARAEQVAEAVRDRMSRWLLGQAVSMLAVAGLTLAGLLLIGMPLAVPLAVIAGAFEFVPYIGPFASGLLIAAVALSDNETQALKAVLVCVAVQQSEAYLVQPLVQRWAVRMPPALALLAVVVFGLLFGVAGLLLAVPLMVLTMALVEQLYVKPLQARAGR